MDTNATDVDSSGPWDPPYLDYLAGINTFAEALNTRRGKVFHSEQNAPVYHRPQSLAAAVHVSVLFPR